VWESSARLATALNDNNATIEYREKQCRTLEQRQWLEDKQQFANAVEGVKHLIAAYLRDPSTENIYSGKLHVDGIIAKSKNAPALTGHPGLDTLAQLLKELASASPSSRSSSSSDQKATPLGGGLGSSYLDLWR